MIARKADRCTHPGKALQCTSVNRVLLQRVKYYFCASDVLNIISEHHATTLGVSQMSRKASRESGKVKELE